MTRAISALAFAAAFAAALFRCSRGPVAGRLRKSFRVRLPAEGATVVPSLSQEIFAIGAQDFLLGNSNYCIYPEAAKSKPRLGGLLNPDYEKIASFKPDIFLLPLSPTGRAIARRLESVGVRAFFTNPEGIGNISKDVALLGRVFFRDAEAEKIARGFDAELSSPGGRAAGRGRRALFMFGNMAAGAGSFVGGLLEACGLENCADASARRGRFSPGNLSWPQRPR